MARDVALAASGRSTSRGTGEEDREGTKPNLLPHTSKCSSEYNRLLAGSVRIYRNGMKAKKNRQCWPYRSQSVPLYC